MFIYLKTRVMFPGIATFIYIYAHYACQNLCSLRSTSSNKEFTFFFFLIATSAKQIAIYIGLTWKT